MLIANDVSGGKVFNSDESEVYILTPNSPMKHIEISSKQNIAFAICSSITTLISHT